MLASYPQDVPFSFASHDGFASGSPEAEQKPLLNLNLDNSFMRADKRSFMSPDAPIQPRKYIIPSDTSRREFTSQFIRHCPYSSTLLKENEDEHDQLIEEGGSMDPETIAQILDKRRRNTLSARKSRMKKQKQMQDLEEERDDLLQRNNDYRHYVAKLQQLLDANGIPYDKPSF